MIKVYTVDFFERNVLKNIHNIEQFISVIKEKEKAYYNLEINKANGKDKRVIHCIEQDSKLYSIQKQLKDNLFSQISVSDYCYGYKKGVSYRDFLLPHLNKKYYLRLDIKDFFNSIDFDLLEEVLIKYVEKTNVNGDFNLLKAVIEAVTLNNTLPQGAVTSPVLSNIIFRQLDIRISRFCQKNNIFYTRYVDDLLFSSEKDFVHSSLFITRINKILNSKKFSLNYKKVKKMKNEISLNGFVVGKEIRISRKKKQLISTILYSFKTDKPIDKFHFKKLLESLYKIRINSIFDLQNFLGGYRSFLISWLPFNSVGELDENLTVYDKKNINYINQIEQVLKFLNK